MVASVMVTSVMVMLLRTNSRSVCSQVVEQEQEQE